MQDLVAKVGGSAVAGEAEGSGIQGQQEQGGGSGMGQEEQGEEEEGDDGGAVEGKRSREADWENVESRWEEKGWLKSNPLGVPTEREFYVEQKGLPVYRVMLTKKAVLVE